MYVYDKKGTQISVTTTNKVYVGSTKGKMVKPYIGTFSEFYYSLSDKEVANLWKLAITSLGLEEYPDYSALVPFNFNFLLEEEDFVKPIIWKYIMISVGYPKYTVDQLDYESFANKQLLLGYERVYLTKDDIEYDAFEYLLSANPSDRLAGYLYNELDLRGVKYVMFDLDNKHLPIMVFANNSEDTNPFFNNSSQIMIKQPRGYLENQFEINDGGKIYDIIYNKPRD